MSDLDKKVRQSVQLLESLRDNYDGVVELSYSGGKDSDIILELAKYAGLKYRAIYKRTTIDPPYTETHVKSKGAEVVKPKHSFFELVRQKGFPTMRARFCCKELKEYKILDKAVQGIRKSESKKRMKRYTEPSFCRTYEGGGKTEIFLPILEWTNDDVYNFVVANRIRCHPLYYDEKGRFDVNRRLGCMGCPLSVKNAIMDYHQYPQLLKLYLKNGQIWLDTHPNVASHKKFGNVYNLFFYDYFCKSYEDYLYKTTGMFGNLDCKEFLSNYFRINL